MSAEATMLDHYSDVGFRVLDEEHFEALLSRVVEEGARIDFEGGHYMVWGPGAGIELWVQFSKRGKIIGCMPRFRGRSRTILEVERLIRVRDFNKTGGILSGRSCPGERDFGTSVPVLADSPDFNLLRSSLRCPATVKTHIGAFSHGIRCFESADEYERIKQSELPPPPPGPEPEDMQERARRAVNRMTRAPESYFPIGQSSRPRSSMVDFSGRIRRTKLLVNPDTKRSFHHMAVKTYGGLFVDVVADPRMVSGKPRESGILEGTCCFSARVELQS